MRMEARARLRLLLAARHNPLPADDTIFRRPKKVFRFTNWTPCAKRISCLTSHGGLTGVPQVNLSGRNGWRRAGWAFHYRRARV